jgi:hypothetical protein
MVVLFTQWEAEEIIARGPIFPIDLTLSCRVQYVTNQGTM